MRSCSFISRLEWRQYIIWISEEQSALDESMWAVCYESSSDIDMKQQGVKVDQGTPRLRLFTKIQDVGEGFT